MKQRKKRLLSVVLAAMMMVSLLPMTALAEEADVQTDAQEVETQKGNLPAFTSAVDETALGDSAATDNTVSAEESTASVKSKTATVALTGGYFYSEAYPVLKLINQERKKAGLNPVKIDSKLNAAAMQRAAECAVYFSHTRPSGEDCFSVLPEYGISAGAVGENIAAGQDSADSVMETWMNSDGHRANILNEDYTAVGLGCYLQYGGVPCWVQVFTDGSGDSAAQPEDELHTTYVKANEDYIGMMMVVLEKNKLALGGTTQLETGLVNQGWNNIIWFPEDDSLTYSSSKTSVATISSHGKVTAKSKGSAAISAKLYGTKYTASDKLTVTANIADAKVAGLKLSNQKTGIQVKWNKLSLAKQYEIYRSTAGGSYQKVKTTTSTSWTDTGKTNGTKYKYKVYGVNGSKKSKASAARTMIRLTRVSLQSVTPYSSGTILLEWTRNSKADGYWMNVYLPDGTLYGQYTMEKGGTTRGLINELPSGKKLKVNIACYKKSGNTMYLSASSASKTVRVP